jgi:hypothetical protein
MMIYHLGGEIWLLEAVCEVFVVSISSFVVELLRHSDQCLRARTRNDAALGLNGVLA